MHGRIGCDGSLEQIGMKRQQAVAVTGGALGEHANHITRTQPFGHVVDNAHGIPARRPLDEQGSSTRCQSANHGPLPDVCLGDKTAIPRGMQRDDVKP